MSLTKDQERTEIEVQRAVSQQGKKFISLRLIDASKRRIQGAMVLHASPYLDQATNIKQFHFEERGGPLQFIDDEMRGGMFCRMLDCEHNRKFLASMFGYKFWEIEDAEVLVDITERAAAITKNAVIVKPNQPKEAKMSDSEIATEMARLQAEQAKRTVAKADGSKRKPAPEFAAAAPATAPDAAPGPEATPIEEITDPIPDKSPEPEQKAAPDQAPSGKPAKRRSSLASIGG
jgi:hypothetical protein